MSMKPESARELPACPPAKPSGDGTHQAEMAPAPSDAAMERMRRANTVLLGQDAMPAFRPSHGEKSHGFEP